MGTKFFYFDLGNVLLGFSHEQSARQVAQLTGCSYELAWDTVFGPGQLEIEYETGLIDNAEFHRKFSERTGTKSDLDAFIYASSAIFWPIYATIPVVAHLHGAGYRVGLLSNTCQGHWEYVWNRFAFMRRYFETYVLSCSEKVMKPNADIYSKACDRVALTPGDVFFVDDREDNVAAAQAAGMDAVLFTTANQLLRDLMVRGVRINL